MTDLKPCPFCAVDMTHSEALSSRNSRRMVHPRNGCVLEGIVLDISSRPDDIDRAEKWNRRATAAEATVTALAEALVPFVREANRLDPSGPCPSIGDSCEIWQCGSPEFTRSKITYGDLRRARTALDTIRRKPYE